MRKLVICWQIIIIDIHEFSHLVKKNNKKDPKLLVIFFDKNVKLQLFPRVPEQRN